LGDTSGIRQHNAYFLAAESGKYTHGTGAVSPPLQVSQGQRVAGPGRINAIEVERVVPHAPGRSGLAATRCGQRVPPLQKSLSLSLDESGGGAMSASFPGRALGFRLIPCVLSWNDARPVRGWFA
jgi:hypothetical protein